MRFLTIILTLSYALASSAQATDVRKNLDTALGRVRTQVSLVLYSQVLLELLEQNREEENSWLATLQKLVKKDYDPAKVVEANRKCLTSGLELWGRMTEKGESASTAELTTKLLNANGLSADCQTFWNSLVGEASYAYAHGQFLQRLQDAELLTHLQARKLAHLEATKFVLISAGQKHLGAAARIASYYSEDKDPAVSGLAKDVLAQIPTAEKARALFSVVRPDSIMFPAVATTGALRLVSNLPNALTIKAFIGSLGVHLGGGASYFKFVADAQSAANPKFELRTDKNPSVSDPWLRSLLQYVASFSNDLLAKDQFLLSTEKRVDRYFRLGKDDFDFPGFVIQLDMDYVPGMSPLEFNAHVENLRRLSAEVGIRLSSSIPLQDRLNDVRSLVFTKTAIEDYRSGQPNLVPLLQGRGGNCVANTKLMLSLLWPHRHLLGPNKILALEVFRDHIQPVIFDKVTLTTIDMVSGFKWERPRSALYHPSVLLNGLLVKQKKTDRSLYRFRIRAAQHKSDQAQKEMSQAKALEQQGKGVSNEETLEFPKEAVASGGSTPRRAKIRLNVIRPHPGDAKNKSNGKGRRALGGNAMGESNDEQDNEDEEGDSYFESITESEDDSDISGSKGGSGRGGFGSGHESGNQGYGSGGQGDRKCSDKRYFSPGYLPPDNSNFVSFKYIENILMTSACFTEKRGSVPQRLLGFDILVPSDEIRNAVASATTDQERADSLLPMVVADAKRRIQIATKVKSLLLNPTVAISEFGGTRLSDYLFQPESLFQGIKVIESIRSGIHYSDDDPTEAMTILQVGFAVPEINASIALDLEILGMMSRSPEALAKFFDSASVPQSNKAALREVMSQGLLAHTARSSVFLRPEEYSRALLTAREAFDSALADPSVIGISEHVSPQSVQAPRFQVLAVKEKSPVTIAETRKDQGKTPVVTFQLHQGCASLDSAGRCRQQDIQNTNTIAARTYVSPVTYFEMLGIFNGISFSDEYEIASLKRWDDRLQRLFINYLIDAAKTGLREVQKAGDTNNKETFPSWRIIGLKNKFQPFFANSPWKLTDYEVKAKLDNLSKMGGFVHERTEIQIPVPRALFEVDRCNDERNIAQDSLTGAPRKKTRSLIESPAYKAKVFKAFPQVVDIYTKCLTAALSQMP